MNEETEMVFTPLLYISTREKTEKRRREKAKNRNQRLFKNSLKLYFPLHSIRKSAGRVQGNPEPYTVLHATLHWVTIS